MDRLGEEAGEGKDMAAAEDSGGLGEVEAGTEDGELYDGEFGTPSTPLAEEDEASAALQVKRRHLLTCITPMQQHPAQLHVLWPPATARIILLWAMHTAGPGAATDCRAAEGRGAVCAAGG